MNQANITFIGAGNMARALIAGLIADKYDADKIWASSPNAEELAFLQQQYHIHTTQDNITAAAAADVIVLAVKPQHIAEVCQEIQAVTQEKQPLFISIAAGITIATLQRALFKDVAVVRTMPNIAAQVSAGATGLYANAQVVAIQKDIAESIFRTLGVTLWVAQEAQLDIVTALSGSGPGYLFLMMEAMQKAAEQLGLSADDANLLTKQTFLGASRLALESEATFPELRRMVTSPNGTTAAAIQVLEDSNIHKLIHDTMQAAYQRAKELAG